MNTKKKVEKKPRPIHCSFCEKSQHDVVCIVAGTDVFICDECVAVSSMIVLAKRREDLETDEQQIKATQEDKG